MLASQELLCSLAPLHPPCNSMMQQETPQQPSVSKAGVHCHDWAALATHHLSVCASFTVQFHCTDRPQCDCLLLLLYCLTDIVLQYCLTDIVLQSCLNDIVLQYWLTDIVLQYCLTDIVPQYCLTASCACGLQGDHPHHQLLPHCCW
jgi:hypothetical protein